MAGFSDPAAHGLGPNIETVHPFTYLFARPNASQVVRGTIITLDLDNVDLNVRSEGSIFTISTIGVITAEEAEKLILTGRVSIDTLAGTEQNKVVKCSWYKNGVEIAGSSAWLYSYEKDKGAGTMITQVPVDVVPTDTLELKIIRTVGAENLSTLEEGCSVLIVRRLD